MNYERCKRSFKSALEIVRDNKIQRNEEDPDGFRARVRFITEHTIVFGLILSSIKIIQWLLDYLLGKEAKFFDLIPIRYTTDFADVAVIVKYVWYIAKPVRRKK